jgi:hypothetical protein
MCFFIAIQPQIKDALAYFLKRILAILDGFDPTAKPIRRLDPSRDVVRRVRARARLVLACTALPRRSACALVRGQEPRMGYPAAPDIKQAFPLVSRSPLHSPHIHSTAPLY